MTIVAALPIIAAILGALAWAFASGKLSEAGKIVFACGVLVILWMLAGKVVKVG
jgi:hypothetical protein